MHSKRIRNPLLTSKKIHPRLLKIKGLFGPIILGPMYTVNAGNNLLTPMTELKVKTETEIKRNSERDHIELHIKF